MNVRLLKPWHGSASGEVVNLAREVAADLIFKGIATHLGNVDMPAKHITAPPADKMMRKNRARSK